MVMRETLESWVEELLVLLGVIKIDPLSETHAYIDEYVIILIAALIGIVGVLQCFLGRKFFPTWCGIMGMVLGVIGGVMLVVQFVPDTAEWSGIISVFFILCLGIVGAFIAFRASTAGVFLYAFSTLFLMLYFPISGNVENVMIAVIVGVCVGVLAGVAAVIFQKISVITLTSLMGGVFLIVGMMLLLENASNVFTATGLPIITGILCAGGGLFVQLITNKDKPAEPQPVQVVIAAQPAATVAPAVPATPAEPATPVETTTAVPAPVAEATAAAPAEAEQATTTQVEAAPETTAAEPPKE